jgi:hypothetical protein
MIGLPIRDRQAGGRADGALEPADLAAFGGRTVSMVGGMSDATSRRRCRFIFSATASAPPRGRHYRSTSDNAMMVLLLSSCWRYRINVGVRCAARNARTISSGFAPMAAVSWIQTVPGSTRVLRRLGFSERPGSCSMTFFRDYSDDISARIRDVDPVELERLSELS